jgi:multidrug efflux pump
VAVFLPLAFIGGVTGRLVLEFAGSLSVSVIISTGVALTLSPMAAARVLRPVEATKHGGVYNYLERKFDALNARYERGLAWSLHHRWAIALIALLSLGLSGYFYVNLDQEFLPEEDKGRLMTLAITPVGSSPEYTGRMIRKVEGILNDEPAVDSYFAAVALPFAGPGDPTLGLAFVRLKDEGRPSARDIVDGPHGLFARLITEVEGAISIPIMPKAVETGFGQPFELVIKHPDLHALDAYVQQLTGRFMQEGFLGSPRSAFQMNKPEVSVEIDRDRAAELGVSVLDISRTLQISLGGEDVSSIKLDGKQYEVIAQLNREHRMTPDEISSMYVRNVRGDLVQLGNVLSVSESAGPTEIQRHARERSATIGATPMGIPLGVAMERTEAILAETLPDGFAYTWQGDAENLVESSNDIYGFMILAIIVVYMVLAAQFESFFSPFVVMLALPLALVGAFGMLYILSWVNHFGVGFYGWAHYAPDPPAIAGILSSIVPRIPSMNINIFSRVGLILLIGMVTKNSILLVEFANQQRAKGLSATDAMLKAGLIRLRPILMTSMATIAGLLPIAIGFGAGAESRRPLGVVAVGGMITSTLLTLFVIPVMYSLLADFGKRRIRR